MGGENLAVQQLPRADLGTGSCQTLRCHVHPSPHLAILELLPGIKRVLELSYLPDPIAPLPVKAMERADWASHRKGERKPGLIKYRLIGKHAQLTADGIGRRGCQLGHHD